MQEDPTGQGAAKGSTQGLTDDPWKETKPRPGTAPGPREAGRTDVWQVRTGQSPVALQVAPARTPGLSLSNQNKQ